MLRTVAFLIFSVGLLLAVGCSDDPVDNETTGSIIVNPEPNSINAPWTLSGTGSRTGEGDLTLSKMAEGAYTITWGAVADWTAPSSETRTLTAGSSVTFNGTYTSVPDAAGTIVINGSPDTIDFPWTLTRPDLSTMEETGDATLSGMAVGEYTLNWNALEGWNAPAAETLTLTENHTISFIGEYTIQLPPRTIVVNPLPGYVDAPWELTGPEDATGNGYTILENMTAGEYTITWNDAVDWTTPDGDTQTLTVSNVVTFEGRYVSTNDVLIPAGTFDMGSPGTEVGRGPDEDQHSVTLTTDFYMMASEITHAEFLALMGFDPSPNWIPGTASKCTTCPVDSVSWFNAIAFCNAKSISDGFTPVYVGSGSSWTWNPEADGWRLPTESEWEYACRAGTTTTFNTGDCLDSDSDACFDGTYPYDTCPIGPGQIGTVTVKSFAPNAWGLYDMHGNVKEWCWNWEEPGKAGQITLSVDKDFGAALRGGGRRDQARDCRSAKRLYSSPAYAQNDVGIRLVRTAF